MDTKTASFFKTHFSFFNLGFLSPRMSFFFAYFLPLFALLKQSLFRLKEKIKPQKRKSSSVLIQPREQEEEEKRTDANVIEEKMESFLSFRFRTYEEFIRNNGENLNEEEETCYVDNQVSDDDSDDEFFEVESYMDDEISLEIHHGNNSVCVEEPHIDSAILGSADSDSVNVEHAHEDCHIGISPRLVRAGHTLEVVEETEEHTREVNDHPIVCDLGESLEDEKVKNEEKLIRDEVKDSEKNAYCLSSEDDDESLVSDSDSDSMASSSKFSLRTSVIDSNSDGFLSDIDFERAFEVDTSMEFDGEETYSSKKVLIQEDIELENLNRGYESDDFEDEDEDEDLLKELKKLESEIGPNEETKLEDEKQQQTTSSVNLAETKLEDKQNGKKPNSGEQLSSDFEDQNELERQWEHQDLVEQLKMEIKKVKAIGLPTILEESETPKITEDLKPWKIEEKFHREDTLDELHKFYKSYRERMRKLDILNYQKMYAIGFLRLKDPLESFTRNKLSNPSMAAIVSLDCWSCKGKSAMTEVEQPVLKMKKFSRELERELEMVYVGQMCLSWEFLRWEYGKALKLWDSDLHGIRRYNKVADKFQQFQVLITRFLEDEPFQGPRVHHYVKTRCVHQNLLQVPVIREDNLRDDKKKLERKWMNNKAVTSVKLVEIMEESIRILWQFIRSDKWTSNAVLVKGCGRSNVELQNPADAVLLEQLRSTLHKKEKRLKELTRRENCILRKIRKRQHLEDGTDNVRYFFSQVDLKLVCRVLNMSKLSTQQLGWCYDKLNKISVVGGKLYADSSFLLFPCS